MTLRELRIFKNDCLAKGFGLSEVWVEWRAFDSLASECVPYGIEVERDELHRITAFTYGSDAKRQDAAK